MPEPTQAQLDAEFQAQLDQEFQALPRPKAPSFLESRAALPPEGLASPSVTPNFQPDLARGEAIGGSMALGMLGGAAGFGAGAALGGPALLGAPLGGLAGEAVGMAGADVATRALTGEPQSLGGTLTTAATPLAARGATAAIGAGLRVARRVLPGFSAGAQQAGAATLKAIPGQLQAGAPSVDDLYAVVEQHNPTLKMPALTAALGKLGSTEAQISQGLKSPRIGRTVAGLKTLLDHSPNGVPFQVLRHNLRRVGARVGAAARVGGEEEGALKLLYRAMQEDFEAFATGAAASATPSTALAVQALKRANGAARREFAVGELEDAIGKAVETRSDGLTQLNLKRLFKAFDDDPKMLAGLDPKEAASIKATVKALTKIPALPTRAGATFGSGQTVGRGLGVSGALSLMGVDPVTAGSIGAAIAPLPQYLSRLMVTEPGRQAVVRILSTSPTLNHTTVARLAAVTRVLTMPTSVDLEESRARLNAQ